MVQESLISGIIRSLRSNAGWVAVIMGLSMLFALCLNKYVPTVYESEALLRVLTTDEKDESLAASMNGILSKKPIISEISEKSGLSESEIRRENTILLFDEGHGLVKLIVRHENPEMLKELGNAVIKVLSEHFLGYNSETHEFEIKTLKARLSQLETSLVEAKTQLASAKEALRTEVDETSVTLENLLHQLEDKIENNSSKLQNMPKEVFYYQEEESKDYKIINAQLKEERNNLAELFKSYKDKHPRIVSCRNRIEELEKNIKSARTRVKKTRSNSERVALAAEIDVDKERAEQIKNELMKHRENAELSSPSQTQLAALQIRIQTLEELHRKNLLELEESRICLTTSAGHINVLKKDSRPPQNVGFSSGQRDAIVVASGILLAVFLLYTPAPVRTEVVNISGQAMASAVMPAEPFERLEIQSFRAEPAEIILEAPRLLAEPIALPCESSSELETTAMYDERLIALNSPDSSALTPYKKLVSNLQISISEAQTRIVIIASAHSRGGKTTLLANTAALMANAGYSVIMIDANFRNPELHKVFDSTNYQGLSDALRGEDVSKLVQNTCVHGLSLLTSGISPISPAEALGSPAMIELLANLKRKYELIFIDTPAMLEYPETGIMSGHTGAIVFLSSKDESKGDLRAAKALINKVRAKVFGYVTI